VYSIKFGGIVAQAFVKKSEPMKAHKPDSMLALRYLSLLVSWIVVTSSLSGADQPSLDSQLEPLRPLLDKTWKGAFKNSKPEKPVVDVMRWERALNGKAVRVLHSVNDGSYGGETIFMWDEKKREVGYHYFTTAGFMTVGSMSFKDGKLTTHEVVTGSAGGVTEVRGTSELLPDGTLRVRTEHMKDGKWQPGREVTYVQDPGAKVVFK
jgi:hypothetical protein